MNNYKFIILPEVEQYLTDLEVRKTIGDKDARIMFEKIAYCIERVRLQGTRAELRPIDERIFMCLWNGNHFVMLSHYTKDANETDELQLAKARRLRDKYIRDHTIDIKEKNVRKGDDPHENLG